MAETSEVEAWPRVRAAPRWRPTPASIEREAALRAELARLVEGLVAMGARLIVLFGSVARGEVAETSDLDLLVVMETSERFVARAVRIAEALQPQVAVDLLVYTPAEFEAMRDRAFVRQALAEGQVLHAAET